MCFELKLKAPFIPVIYMYICLHLKYDMFLFRHYIKTDTSQNKLGGKVGFQLLVLLVFD
jgi:hypothetical protein